MKKSSGPMSLRSRLLIWLLGPLLIIGLIALWDANNAARVTADEISDRLLAGSVLAIAEQVFVNDDGELEVDVPYVALQMLTSSADDRVFYRIETLEGEFITGYRRLELPAPSDTDTGETQFFDSQFRGSPIRIARFEGVASSNTKSLGYRVGVAETTNARAAIAEQILVRSALRQFALIATAAVLVWVAVTNALKPLSKLKRAIDRRNPDDMRPIKHDVPLEVEGVVERINDLLMRFSNSIDALRNFTSNASHQFRTPLALINTHLELAQRAKNNKEKSGAIRKAQKAVRDAERLMSQLLLLSRIDTLSKGKLESETCDLSQVGREVCEEFVLRYSNQDSVDLDLGFSDEGKVPIHAEKTLTQEVIRNLIDNAIKHGGKSGRIDVTVTRDDDGGHIAIRDYGGGFNLDRTLHSSGSRNHASDPQTGPGMGIGLTIVREIADLLQAKLRAKEADPGPGMIVSVSFRAMV